MIASNRKYLRGAGTADCTADASKRDKSSNKQAQRETCREIMTTCYITKTPLDYNASIVICPYGRLYQKEAALQALLQRRHSNEEEENKNELLGKHVRGLKDLYEVRMELRKSDNGSNLVPVCPVTGLELNGQIPAFLIVSKTTSQPNVVSERAFKEMGMEALQAEYGAFDKEEDTIRLAPPPSMMDTIKEKLETKRLSKKSKNGKKRKKNNSVNDKKKKTKSLKTDTKKANGSVAEAARERVATAVASNTVLSSLFTGKSSVSEKEKKDNLFAR